eukprot:CAMPEP_0179845600 /NCGR_PEP_ID=MMETSP0982-20121206/5112_1 /TAXON_ID=483367 /ORGANISM="non described non described, Strain CCMP 2436" /LENGTH=77 /DNA_ID=CAMNT_0021730681 /DNA_START=214 /DNA_END=447 /DNA_ORIENTATION=+
MPLWWSICALRSRPHEQLPSTAANHARCSRVGQSSAEVAGGSPPLSLPASPDEFLRAEFSLLQLDDGGRPLKSGGLL